MAKAPTPPTFNVVVTMEIAGETDETFHANYTLNYDHVGYPDMVAMQKAVALALIGLGEAKINGED